MFCHLTSLVASRVCVKNCVALRDAKANSSEICKTINLSPHREALFKQIRQKIGETGARIKKYFTQNSNKISQKFSGFKT